MRPIEYGRRGNTEHRQQRSIARRCCISTVRRAADRQAAAGAHDVRGVHIGHRQRAAGAQRCVGFAQAGRVRPVADQRRVVGAGHRDRQRAARCPVVAVQVGVAHAGAAALTHRQVIKRRARIEAVAAISSYREGATSCARNTRANLERSAINGTHHVGVTGVKVCVVVQYAAGGQYRQRDVLGRGASVGYRHRCVIGPGYRDRQRAARCSTVAVQVGVAHAGDAALAHRQVVKRCARIEAVAAVSRYREGATSCARNTRANLERSAINGTHRVGVTGVKVCVVAQNTSRSVDNECRVLCRGASVGYRYRCVVRAGDAEQRRHVGRGRCSRSVDHLHRETVAHVAGGRQRLGRRRVVIKRVAHHAAADRQGRRAVGAKPGVAHTRVSRRPAGAKQRRCVVVDRVVHIALGQRYRRAGHARCGIGYATFFYQRRAGRASRHRGRVVRAGDAEQRRHVGRGRCSRSVDHLHRETVAHVAGGRQRLGRRRVVIKRVAHHAAADRQGRRAVGAKPGVAHTRVSRRPAGAKQRRCVVVDRVVHIALGQRYRRAGHARCGIGYATFFHQRRAGRASRHCGYVIHLDHAHRRADRQRGAVNASVTGATAVLDQREREHAVAGSRVVAAGVLVGDAIDQAADAGGRHAALLGQHNRSRCT